MSWLSRFLNLARRNRLDSDLEEELSFHLTARIDELIAEGRSPAAARDEARRQLGNPLLLRETSRDVKLFTRFESIARDLTFGLRLWRRNPMVTAAAVVSLSLAIGACTAAFSLLDALILRPLPVRDPQRLIYLAYRAPGDTRDSLSLNYPLFERLRDAARDRAQLFVVSDQSRAIAVFDDASGAAERIYGQGVSGNTLAVLGVKPAVGRLLQASDDLKPGRHPVAVLSYDFWSRRFRRDPQVIGRWVTIREKQLQIIGVAENGFTGLQPGIMTDLWAPAMMWNETAISDPGTRWLQVWGRLHGDRESELLAVLQTVFTDFRRQEAAERLADEPRARRDAFLNTAVYLRPAAGGTSYLREEFGQALWVLASVALLVLLIACANVAAILLARGAARDREMALRISIGAGRGRLIQQMLIESALLSIAACALGTVIASLAAPQVVAMLSTPRSIVRLDLHIDWRLLTFLGAVGSLTTFLFGLVPALRASAVAPGDAIKSSGSKHTGSGRLFRPLVAAQTAFGFVVLFLAAMCLSSFTKLLRTDFGFEPENLVIVRVEARELRAGGPRARALWEQLVERLRETPGIQAASLSGWGLFEGRGRNKRLRIPGRAPDGYDPWYLPVSPGFLSAMRIRLLDGRDLDWRDTRADSPSAVLVNESFARRYFPGESALGRRFFRVDGQTLVSQEIVGVAENASYTSVREPAPPTVYDPLQAADSATVQVRTELDPAALASLLRAEFPRVHPAFQVTDVILQSRLIEGHLVRDRALALLSAFFSAVAIVLVAVGLYGVLSYTVAQRTREIGVRLALGGRPSRVAISIVLELGLVIATGLVVGAASAIPVARSITALLHQVTGFDAVSIGAPLLCLLVAGVAAAAFPAARAARVDPATALRYE